MVSIEVKNGLVANNLEYKSKPKEEYITFRDIWLFAKRYFFLFATTTIVGIFLGFTYIINTSPVYFSVARVVMDPGQAKIATQDETSGTVIIESAEIASQVEIVKSESVASAVIHQLDLTEDPEILNSTSLRSTIQNWIISIGIKFGVIDAPASSEELTEEQYKEQLMRRTMAGFLGRLSARQVGQSYVLEIGYASVDPNHAARVANAAAQTYIKQGLADRRQALQQGGVWLEERLVELGNRARESQLAVEQYRATKGLTSTGVASQLDHQQLVETSSQLLAAKADTAAETAKLETIRQIAAGGVPDGEIDESLTSAGILKLRDEIREAKANFDAVEQRYMPDNKAVLAAKTVVENLQTELQNEFMRIENVFQSNVNVAQAKERILTSKLSELREQGVDNNLARVDLAELESRASTYRLMYESILQQLINALQFQSFPLGTARIVTPAAPPLGKDSPKASLVLPFSMIVGLSAGIFIAGWREVMDRRLGTGSKLAREMGIAVVGAIPFKSTDQSWWRKLSSNGKHAENSLNLAGVLQSPYSNFSESLRDIKFAIDWARETENGYVIGVASEQNGDGKTTISTNLAQLCFNEGIDTVLVDADFQNGTLTELVCDPGDALTLGLSRLDRYQIKKFESSGTSGSNAGANPGHDANIPLPVVTLKDIGDSTDLNQPQRLYWHLPALHARISQLRSKKLLVFVDMPSFSASADARSVCGMVDSVIIVVGNPRGATLDTLSATLSKLQNMHIRILGVLLNRSGKENVKRNSRPPTAMKI